MFVMVVVVMCHMISPGAAGTFKPYETCREIFVTDSDQTPSLSFMSCQLSQPAIAEWKMNSKYADDSYRIDRIKCIPDRSYTLKDAI